MTPATGVNSLQLTTCICFSHALNVLILVPFLTHQGKFTVNPDPLIGQPPSSDWSKSSYRIIAFSTLLARRLIHLKRTHSSPPTHNRWIQEILLCIRLEKIRFSLKYSFKTFYFFLRHIYTLSIEAENQLTSYLLTLFLTLYLFYHLLIFII